jgi:tetratricopeptide (TPR) repeat protein
MYREMGKFDEAIQYLETALENTDGEIAVKTRVVLANTYVRKGENESASRLLDEAFDSLKSKDSVVAGLIWNERGMMNFRSGHREESHECFEKSFPLFQKHRDRRMIAGTLNALAGGYRYKGEFDKAIEHTQRALRILRRMGDNTEVLKMLQNLGLIYYPNPAITEKKSLYAVLGRRLQMLSFHPMGEQKS